MDAVVIDKELELVRLCRRHHVSRLDLFGSAARVGGGARDLDFLVEFEDLPEGAHADTYFGFLADLEDLFGRPVDLVMASAITNPFVRGAIQRSRVPLYAA